MDTEPVTPAFPILEGLRADRPFEPWREQLMLFGQFVGVWRLNVQLFDQTGHRRYMGRWEWSFAWILDGRAIQDVIVIPDPARCGGGPPRLVASTTIRYCDSGTGMWKAHYLRAVSGVATILAGGAVGDSIVLAGAAADGTQSRWTFSDITPDSFTWTGLESADGVTWWRNQHMLATRTSL
jgi:hypothetical protein